MLNAMLIYSCAIYTVALRLAADHRSGLHRRVVQQGFCGVWMRRHASASLFALLPNAILIYTCAINAFAFRLAVDSTALAHTAASSGRAFAFSLPIVVDAGLRQYAFAVRFGRVLMANIQRAGCIFALQKDRRSFADRGRYTARLIYSCAIYASAWLLAADCRPSPCRPTGPSRSVLRSLSMRGFVSMLPLCCPPCCSIRC